MVQRDIQKYIDLLRQFLDRKIDAASFEGSFLRTYKYDESKWSSEEFEVLESVFASVDAFCSDASIRDADDIDENQLRIDVANAAEQLKKLRR